jgi:hypothetical protein
LESQDSLPVVPPLREEPVVPPRVLADLDRVANDLREESDIQAVTDAVVVGGLAATAGFVLLNTRAVYWFLAALLTRPAVWRRFDPLDVIYAWEAEQKAGRK